MCTRRWYLCVVEDGSLRGVEGVFKVPRNSRGLTAISVDFNAPITLDVLSLVKEP